MPCSTWASSASTPPLTRNRGRCATAPAWSFTVPDDRIRWRWAGRSNAIASRSGRSPPGRCTRWSMRPFPADASARPANRRTARVMRRQGLHAVRSSPMCSDLGVEEYRPHAQAPEWFCRALAVPQADVEVQVDGCAIHALACGRPGARGLVFVHGGGAHAHWWTHVAARFSNEFRVLCIDLSGHGDSGHRDRYSLEQWTEEVMAVAAVGQIAGAPVIVGHSMGGFVTIATAARHGDRVSGAIVCDSPVTEPDPEIGAYRLREAFGRPRVYPTAAEAVQHFRTVPAQEHYLDYVIDHVARQSLRPVHGGWQWKFDREIFAQFGGGIRGIALPYLSRVVCRLALLRSEHGLVTADIGRSMYDELGRARRWW